MSKCIYSGKFVKVTHNKGSRNLMPLLSKSTLNGKAGNSSTVEKSEKWIYKMSYTHRIIK